MFFNTLGLHDIPYKQFSSHILSGDTFISSGIMVFSSNMSEFCTLMLLPVHDDI